MEPIQTLLKWPGTSDQTGQGPGGKPNITVKLKEYSKKKKRLTPKDILLY